MADNSEINIIVNELTSIINNVLAIDENPDNPNVTWNGIHGSIDTAMRNISDMGELVEEEHDDVIQRVQEIVDAMQLVAEEAEEAEQDGNTNILRLRLQDVIDAVRELRRANENEGVGGYRKRKQRKHRTHRKRKHRTQRRRNRRRTHRNRK